MQYRKFGKSDLTTSVIGFGGFPMGRGQYGPFDDDEVIQSVHRALDLGVTLFDTAAGYGKGQGEELLARALGNKRRDILLVSKGGVQWWNPDSPPRNSSIESLTKGLDDSLSRLETDYLDLYLIHWPDENRPFSEPMEAFAEFQRQGKIRYGGVSNFSVDQMGESLDTFPIVTNQVGYHIFDRRPESDIFPFCNEGGLGAMAFGPMAHGLLTGAMTVDTKFGDDDWRKGGMAFEQPLFQGEHFIKNLGKVARLKDFATDRNRTVAQLALAWVISNPTIKVALAGTRRPSEIEENTVAGDWVLTLQERDEINAIASS